MYFGPNLRKFCTKYSRQIQGRTPSAVSTLKMERVLRHPVVLHAIRWYRIVQSKHTNKVVEYLLLRQHVSALALGHRQVSNCASEETIQCRIELAHIIQRYLAYN